jgi:hypothetical protein
MEEPRSSETFLSYKTKRHHNLEDHDLNPHRRENLKSGSSDWTQWIYELLIKPWNFPLLCNRESKAADT